MSLWRCRQSQWFDDAGADCDDSGDEEADVDDDEHACVGGRGCEHEKADGVVFVAAVSHGWDVADDAELLVVVVLLMKLVLLLLTMMLLMSMIIMAMMTATRIPRDSRQHVCF